MSDTAAVCERSEIPVERTWDLSRVYASWEDWERDFAAVEAAVAELGGMQGVLARSADDLARVIGAVLSARETLGRVAVYASMRSDEDIRHGDNLARDGRAGTLAVRFAEAVSWFEPELLALDEDALAAFTAERRDLELYGHMLDDVRRSRPHTLPREQEALLAAAGNVTRGAHQVFNALDNADLVFPMVRDERGDETRLTKARYSRFIRSVDRRVRRDAFEGFLDAYGGVVNTMAANLDANVKNHVFYARARSHAGTLEAALHANAVPVEVFHSLVGTVNENLDCVHRWVDLKRRVLEQDELCEYDLATPLFPDGEIGFTYEEAREAVTASLAPLGDEYVATVSHGLANRWVDVHESRGKRGGAYSSGTYGTDPYILLNWSGQIRDAFTLTHEMGHSMHSWQTCRHQPYVYAHYPIFTAEVASTFNEMLLMRRLLAETDDPRRRLYLLDTFLDNINGTVFRQTMFAEMEHLMHREGEEGGTLTAEWLDSAYLGLLRRFWGPGVIFDEERSPRTWARIPHFYYNYYVYQYATAFAASAALSERVLSGGAAEREDYLGFLRSGDHRYPVETLAAAGVDMSTPRPVEGVVTLFTSLLDEMESLLTEANP